MVKMQIAGIQVEVPEAEVTFYKRAGYEVVKEIPAEVAPVEKPLESLTVAELRDLAKERGINDVDGLKKADLIALLKQSE